MKIKELTLASGAIPEMKSFYCELLGFPEIPVVGETDGLSFQAGYTRVNFVPGPNDAAYHFAFNIRPDQLPDAQLWLNSKGVPILDGKDARDGVVEFPAWKARSIYCYDIPDAGSGNIIEFIARAAIAPARNAPRFSANAVLGVSEIGIGVDDVTLFSDWISGTHGVSGFTRQENTAEFTALGNDEGLLLLVPFGRKWFMSEIEAQRYPVSMLIENDLGQERRILLP